MGYVDNKDMNILIDRKTQAAVLCQRNNATNTYIKLKENTGQLQCCICAAICMQQSSTITLK